MYSWSIFKVRSWLISGSVKGVVHFKINPHWLAIVGKQITMELQLSKGLILKWTTSLISALSLVRKHAWRSGDVLLETSNWLQAFFLVCTWFNETQRQSIHTASVNDLHNKWNQASTYLRTWAGPRSTPSALRPSRWSYSRPPDGSQRNRKRPVSRPLRTESPPSCCTPALPDPRTAPGCTLQHKAIITPEPPDCLAKQG